MARKMTARTVFGVDYTTLVAIVNLLKVPCSYNSASMTFTYGAVQKWITKTPLDPMPAMSRDAAYTSRALRELAGDFCDDLTGAFDDVFNGLVEDISRSSIITVFPTR